MYIKVNYMENGNEIEEEKLILIWCIISCIRCCEYYKWIN